MCGSSFTPVAPWSGKSQVTLETTAAEIWKLLSGSCKGYIVRLTRACEGVDVESCTPLKVMCVGSFSLGRE